MGGVDPNYCALCVLGFLSLIQKWELADLWAA